MQRRTKTTTRGGGSCDDRKTVASTSTTTRGSSHKPTTKHNPRNSVALRKLRNYVLVRWMRRNGSDVAILSILLTVVLATLYLTTTSVFMMATIKQRHHSKDYGKYKFTPPIARWDIPQNRPVSLLRRGGVENERKHDDDDTLSSFQKYLAQDWKHHHNNDMDDQFAMVEARSSRTTNFTKLPPELRHTFRIANDKGRKEVVDTIEKRLKWKQVTLYSMTNNYRGRRKKNDTSNKKKEKQPRKGGTVPKDQRRVFVKRNVTTATIVHDNTVAEQKEASVVANEEEEIIENDEFEVNLNKTTVMKDKETILAEANKKTDAQMFQALQAEAKKIEESSSDEEYDDDDDDAYSSEEGRDNEDGEDDDEDERESSEEEAAAKPTTTKRAKPTMTKWNRRRYGNTQFLSSNITVGTNTTSRQRDYDTKTAQMVAHFGFTDQANPARWSTHFRAPYERIGFIPGLTSRFSDKDIFLKTFREYADNTTEQQDHNMDDDTTNPIWFLPQGYRITQNQKDRDALRDVLKNGHGMDLPWVLKKTDEHNGLGVQMLAPHSKQLKHLLERLEQEDMELQSDYIVQQYICNELTWFEGQKFDLRMFVFVASVDPLVVLFEDGHARVSKGKYDEDFSNVTQTALHLTNGQFQEHQSFDQHFGFEFLWFRIQKHYEQNYEHLHDELGIVDPVAHIRNQLKESVGRFVEAFVGEENLLNHVNKVSHNRIDIENAFGFYGSDFIIDADLDIWFIEAQASPAMGSYYQYRIDTWHRVLPPMFKMVDEIQMKQEQDPNANVLPLKTRGGWEIVYAGGQGFRYKGYKRTNTKKSCTPKPPPKFDGEAAKKGEEDKTDLFGQEQPTLQASKETNMTSYEEDYNAYYDYYYQYGRWSQSKNRRNRGGRNRNRRA